jgi:molybdopterin converting factor small subunit
MVTLELPGVLRELAGGRDRIETPVDDAADVDALLDRVRVDHPLLERRIRDERGGLRRYVNVYVDGEDVRSLDGTRTALHEGSAVLVLPSIAGG